MDTDKTLEILSLISNIRNLSNTYIEQELKSRGMAGIVPAHGAVLNFLFKQEKPVPIRDIVEYTGRAKSTITVTINTLEKHGYLTKEGAGFDNRIICIALTDVGHKIKDDFMQISDKIIAIVYKSINQEQKESLIELLETIESNLSNLD